ncbi:MAG: prepilin-type N-terminal cleavage/methylation domain-containing protein [candidate division Zixibacteria bacterium]|nr:prepilin-type N-terminal cleavage/methylation domain-containing protein [candidate division Zixibacteria bacterium]
MFAPVKTNHFGFTLVELVIVIVILGIVAAVAVPRFGALTENSKINATKDEIARIKTAIIGDSRVVSGGEYTNRGFEGDVGYAPSRLVDLVHRPDSIPSYNKFTRIGWNGPYLDSAEQHYLTDAWQSPYVYDPNARTITSTSVTPNISTTF